VKRAPRSIAVGTTGRGLAGGLTPDSVAMGRSTPWSGGLRERSEASFALRHSKEDAGGRRNPGNVRGSMKEMGLMKRHIWLFRRKSEAKRGGDEWLGKSGRGKGRYVDFSQARKGEVDPDKVHR